MIHHADITDDILNEVVRIKSAAWPYSYDEHLIWIKKNLKNSDIHVFLEANKAKVAYMNLIDLEARINNETIKVFGVGNVCSLFQGKGYGRVLVNETNKLIISETRVGLLFCKLNLVQFYRKSGWEQVDKSNATLVFDNRAVETMVLNYSGHINSLVFSGSAF